MFRYFTNETRDFSSAKGRLSRGRRIPIRKKHQNLDPEHNDFVAQGPARRISMSTAFLLSVSQFKNSLVRKIGLTLEE
jgi:hypothetical protein